MPGSQIGNRVLVLTAWLHYGLGTTISQIVETFNYHLQMKVTPGGMVQIWHRLAELLYAWYQKIQQEALKSAVLHADETGWRVNGKPHLALVLFDSRSDVLHDRPFPRQSGIDEVLHRSILGDVGQRLLGRVQRGSVWQSTDVPGPSVTRSGIR